MKVCQTKMSECSSEFDLDTSLQKHFVKIQDSQLNKELVVGSAEQDKSYQYVHTTYDLCLSKVLVLVLLKVGGKETLEFVIPIE